VAQRVVDLLGAEGWDIVNVHHNFGFKETHFGEELVVVRKGATPAFPGQRCFVGGSMGDCAVILQGASPKPITGLRPDMTEAELAEHFSGTPYTESAEFLQKAALYSTVHGAGRVMSRTQAAGKWNRRTGVQKSPGLVKQSEMDGWLERAGVVLRGGGLDESPQAYRRLPEVLAAQGPTIEVLHTLKPLVVVMAGTDVQDSQY
jgi:tRNA-splicing ligase RtcB